MTRVASPDRRRRTGITPPRGVPLKTYLRHRGKVRFAIGLLVAILAAGVVTLDQRGWLFYRGGDLQRYDGQTFMVTRVLDGDTLEIAAPDGGKPTTRVRFWGVDAPELDHDGPPVEHDPGGPEARDFSRARAEGRAVKLILEPSRLRDRYGRVLAFVELPDGVVLNEALLVHGLARCDVRWSHRRVERFSRLEMQARHDRIGIWERQPIHADGE